MPRKRTREPGSWLRYENRADGKPKFASKEWFVNFKTLVVTRQLYNHHNEDFGEWSNKFDQLIFPNDNLPDAKAIINGVRLGREEGEDDGPLYPSRKKPRRGDGVVQGEPKFHAEVSILGCDRAGFTVTSALC